MNDCPICMDVIEVNKNCVTTECGHCFHASCLMKNVAHNGFECPYCRHTMAEKPYDETYDVDYMDDDDDDDASVEIRERDMNYALRGFRFMQNNLEGMPHDPNDLTDELYDDDDEETATTLRTTQELPDAAYIARRLFEDGFNVEQLIKCLLFRQEQYMDIVDLEDLDNEFCDKVSKYIETFSVDRHLYDEDDEEKKYDNYTGFKIQRHPSYIYDVNERDNPTSAPSYRCSTR